LRGAGCLTYADARMRGLLLNIVHLAVLAAKLGGPGGVRAVIAENLLLRQQLIVLRRGRQRAPNLTRSDRMLCGFWSLFLGSRRIRKVAIILRPSTLLTFHQALVRRKYRRLFSSEPCSRKPGPKGPDEALIRAIVELKSRNPRFGCPRIARIISQTFGIDIDKNVVYRVLSKHYRPTPGGTGPSWLSFIGHATDSLWSVDLFRCESIVLQSYWVLVVMDQFTRRLVGVAVHCGAVAGADVCRMFNTAIRGQGVPRQLSTDHDPVFEAHRWAANLRILEIDEIKTVPHVPLSHPFVERLIGTMRREFLDHVFFWNGRDLERKLAEFQVYYNEARCHASLNGRTPLTFTDGPTVVPVGLNHVRWVSHSRDLVQLPVAPPDRQFETDTRPPLTHRGAVEGQRFDTLVRTATRGATGAASRLRDVHERVLARAHHR
jgi:putative transposase